MADMSVLAPIGRNGIVNSVRKLSGNIVPGWRDVDSSADFIAGMCATLSSGKLVVADDTASQKIIGLFNCHKTTSFYAPAVAEEGTFAGASSSITLAHAYVQSSTGVKVTNSTGLTTYTLGTDYTVNTTNGLITNLNVGIGATATVLITYRYKDINLTGVDQTLGSGKASTIEGNGEIATQVYNSAAAWAENTAVTVGSDGLPTIGGTGTTIGFVTKVPTASDPELHFQMRIA